MKISNLFCLTLMMATTALFGDDTPLSRTLEYAKGHEMFRTVTFKNHEQEFLRLTKEGQSPRTLFISCSDSRVIPELISSANPGELFVIRTAGNFVPKLEGANTAEGVAATIQYGVEVLKVTDIIVCGHSHCGAIAGLFAMNDPKMAKLDILLRWLRWGEDAKKYTLLTVKSTAPDEERNGIAERLSVIYQLEHLLTYPYIKSQVEAGKIFLHGWHYDIESGSITYYDPSTYQFVPLVTSQKVEASVKTAVK